MFLSYSFGVFGVFVFPILFLRMFFWCFSFPIIFDPKTFLLVFLEKSSSFLGGDFTFVWGGQFSFRVFFFFFGGGS